MAAESASYVDPSWTYFSVENDSFITTSQHCPEQPYVSLKFGIPAANISSQKLSVRRIAFATVSHDQGFSNTADQHGGTYTESSTWFDACVITPSGHDRVPRRHIQANVHAIFEFKTHINRWDWEEGDAGYGNGWPQFRPEILFRSSPGLIILHGTTLFKGLKPSCGRLL
jgi:hypothetical protein